MSVIAVFSDCFSGEKILAESVAARLGYSCVEPDTVIERAAAWGVAHEELRGALLKPPALTDRFLHKRRICLSVLRAALAEEIRTAKAVVYGNLSALLPLEGGGLLRIRVHAPAEYRARVAQESLKVGPGEVRGHIQKMDRDKGRWLRYLRGGSQADLALFDLVVDLEHTRIQDASEAIAHLAAQRRSQVMEAAERAALENLASASRVQAALALDASTAHLELDVQAEGGLVRARGKAPNLEDLDEILRVGGQVPKVTALDLEEVGIGNYETATRFSGGAFVPGGPGAILNRANWWSAAVVMGAVFCFVIVYSIGMDRIVSPVVGSILPRPARTVQTFAGVVTDTLCGAHHNTVEATAAAECVRACVRLRGARYALYDGEHLYALSDQRGAERFAAAKVTVSGSLDEATQTLAVESIRRDL